MSDTHNTVRRKFFDTPPLRYVGSKWMLAEWIINQMPPHRAYIEPFCGSAAVFFRKHRSDLEVLNDLNEEILNFFDVLRTRTDELVHAIRLTPWARAEYERALTNRPTGDKLEDARRFYVVLWQSYGGTEIYKSGWKHTVRAAKRSPLTDTWRRYDGIMDAANRLMDAELQCMDAIECIQKYDAPDALFYVDPPYVKSARVSSDRNRYAHEMSDDQHIALADTLNSIQGMAIVSGYDSPLYDEMLADWTRLTKTSTTTWQTASTEVLWINRTATSNQLPLLQLLNESEAQA